MRLLGLAAPVGLLLTNQGVPPLRGLGFGLPIKQITTETGGPISAPVLEFKFCPIRLLIWHQASRGLPEFMVMDLHVGFYNSVLPSLRFTTGFRASGLPLLTRSSCVSCLLDCKEQPWQGCSSCVLLVCPSRDPASLRRGLIGSCANMLMLRRRGSLLHAGAGACCSSVFVAVGLPFKELGCAAASGFGLWSANQTNEN